MPGLLPAIDPDGLLEYSVVFTDRALNHMSQKFQAAMRETNMQFAQLPTTHRVASAKNPPASLLE